MGRRRRRKQEDDGLAGVLLDLAMASGWIGLVVTIALFVAALVFRARPESLGGLGGIAGTMLLFVAAVLGMATLVGVVKRWADGIGNRPRVQPASRRHARHATPPRDARDVPPSRSRESVTDRPRASRVADAPPAPVSLLSRGEMAFYDPLRDVVAGRFEIHVKPSLADVVQCRDHPDFHEVAKMHVDFVLCDRETLHPRLAIELDDRSHRNPRRAAADRRKGEWLHAAGIPLLR